MVFHAHLTLSIVRLDEIAQFKMMKASSAPKMALSDELASLERRVTAIEQKRKQLKQKFPLVLRTITKDDPPQSSDAFSYYMLVQALSAGFTHTRFVRCPSDYYDLPLERRRAFLRAPHTSHLTKSIVLENLRHNGPSFSNDPIHARYLCCVIPYGCKIDSDALRNVMRRLATDPKPAISNFAFRLAEDCQAITGYLPNAVTPLAMRTAMPVILDASIAALDPPHFWLGGGEVSLKWHVLLTEFKACFNPTVARISLAE